SALFEKTCFGLQAPWLDVRHVSQRNPEVWRQVRIDSEELRRRHADNGKRSAVQVDRATHGVALSAQFALPVTVTHNGYIRSARLQIVLRNGASSNGRHSEHLEEVAAYHLPAGHARSSAQIYSQASVVKAERHKSEHARQGLRALPNRFVGGI